jgi:predicted HicB family RNase H-like nuclease
MPVARTQGQRNFTLRLPPSLLNRLSEIAKEQGLVRAHLIERVLQDWVSSYDKKGVHDSHRV